MRELRRNLRCSVTVFLATVLLFAAREMFGMPGDRLVFAMAILLSGTIAAAVYCTMTNLRTIQEVNDEALRLQKEENQRLLQQVAAENDNLVQRVMTELEGYGDRRAIDAIVSAERRAIVNERAGENTVDLGRIGINGGTNVTSLRRRHRRNDAG
jgi:hypothetical protein